MKQWTTSQVPPGRRALRPPLPALQAAAVPALDGHCAVGDYAAVVEFLLEGAALISSDFLMFFNFNGHGISLDFSSQVSLQSFLEIQEP
jgi:hypothetical protein